jgi:hypothetical protein
METPGEADETNQVQCLPAKKCKAKEASREDVLANKLTFPRAYTNNRATEAVLAKSKQTAVMTMMRPTKTKRNTVVVQHKKKICREGSKTKGLKRKKGTKKNQETKTTSGASKKAT